MSDGGGDDEGEPGKERAPDEASRRDFLRLLGAGSLALAGAGACGRPPSERILPYTVSPPEVTPGLPVQYATSMVLDGHATGLLVQTREGRPIKIEGNPDHPASLGGSGVLEQAAVLGLYDPQRARAMRVRGRPSTWAPLAALLSGRRSDGGAGLRLLLPPTASPLVGQLLERVRRRHPAARITFFAPLVTGQALAGARLLHGRPLQAQPDLAAADVVLVLDDDLLAAGPMHLRHARRLADGRRVARPGAAMSRLYVVETMLTPTGGAADHRLRARPSQLWQVAARLAAQLSEARKVALPSSLRALVGGVRVDEATAAWVDAAARDLLRAAPRALVVVGERQPPAVHALGHLANLALRSAASRWIAPTLLDGGAAAQSLSSLAVDLDRGVVDTVVVVEGNPAYDAPGQLGIGRLLRRAPNSVHLGLHDNETARACSWFVPATHFLESWGDARAHDGTSSLVQPLIAPLFGGRSAVELLALVAGEPRPDAHQLLVAAWRARGLDDAGWERALRRGLVDDSAAPAVDAGAPRWDALTVALAPLAASVAAAPGAGTVEVSFTPDAALHDGRFAGNPWLLELPRPITHLTWDNAALLGPATAARLGVSDEQLVEIAVGGRSARLPALIVPGHADDAVTLPLGFGRDGAETLARGVGTDVYPLRPVDNPWFIAGATLRPLRGRHPLARTQRHRTIENGVEDIVLATTADEYRRRPDLLRHFSAPLPSLMTPPTAPPDTPQWAMSIDLGACLGCSACVVACQAENNIPVVGKQGVLRGREMHWLRIDSYDRGTPDAPRPIHQPMLCQHCEKAPCEYVCPVNATTHSPDGLNEMTYNRCVGTRFCSNNCPYKVRRFNWFDYMRREPPNNGGLVELQRNPDVTVRARGVMEKCTYCVQRIRRAEIGARVAGRPLAPGDVQTACQQACPSRAISFGSLTHPSSEVVAWRSQPRSYAVLHHLGAQPRTRYLARIDNPNPELPDRG